ncbi:class I SAM-dependent methyltransferase [Bacteroides timonensis]|uniref:hypothetical protein n=1 Tax=Bacteroides timonensis TaxID=1470345 RepID=UPI0004B30D68|nr:hypothetical protein [Bacteroides timonensis]
MGKYDAITMIYCDMGTHPDSDRDRLLDNIYLSLTDGGVLIFDVFSEGIIDIYKELLGKNDFTSSSEIFIVAEK